MEPRVALHFRDQLRQARADALADAECFQNVLFVIERLGAFLHGQVRSFGEYRGAVAEHAEASPLASHVPQCRPESHLQFAHLYDLIHKARNDALPRGVFARHLTARCVELSMVLEDALVNGAALIGDYMIRNPVCAYPWQPISFVRQTMLSNSYSYIPVFVTLDGAESWKLISDRRLASYLRPRGTHEEAIALRRQRLTTTLGEALESGELEGEPACMCEPSTPVAKIVSKFEHRPLLVTNEHDTGRLLGIVTALDVL